MVPLDLEVAVQFEKFNFGSGPRCSDAADLNPKMDGFSRWFSAEAAPEAGLSLAFGGMPERHALTQVAP
jgi:hypothetical protein